MITQKLGNSSTGKSAANRSSVKTRIGAALAAGCVLAFSGAFPGAEAQAPRLMAPPLAADGTLSFADLVERVSPAVVSIQVEREVQRPQIPSQLERFFEFNEERGGEEEFFGGEEPEAERAQAEGSGFFIDAAGHIVTNNHVIADADTVRVALPDGRELPAEVIGSDPLTDLAVLKVAPPKGQPHVDFADDVKLRVGDWVVAVGNPFGLGGTVTSGIVSAIGGQNRENQYLDFIQIDAPINRGNSGGPTFDLKGRVVGVNTAIFSPNGGSVGIGFAIPARVAKSTIAQLIKNGSVTRGWLGIQLQEVTTEIAAALGLDADKGVLVAEVLEGTPAFKSGLKDGDVILGIDGVDVVDANDLSRRVAALAPGEKIDVRVSRESKLRNIKVTLGERDGEEQVAEVDDEPANDNDSMGVELGVRISDLDDALRDQYRIPDDVKGAVVTAVRPGSAGQEAGLRPGVVILEVDGADVKNANDLRAKIKNAKGAEKDAVLIRMQFGANRQFGALSLDQ